MTLPMIQRALVDAGQRFGNNSNLGIKLKLIFKKLQHYTAKWQQEAIEYLREQVTIRFDNVKITD